MYPVLFQIGPITIRTYGVCVALAFFIGFFLIYREALRKNIHPKKILDMELCILLSGIIGARVLHVLVNLGYYSANIMKIFFIWEGGLAFYGGLITAILASLVFMIVNRMDIFKTADLFAPYLALGHAIGRIGCFFNGCCYGMPSKHNVLSVIYPGLDNVPRYPIQLYAAGLLLLLFIFLKFLQEKNKFDGLIFILYIVLYGVIRFLLDFLRGDDLLYVFGFTVSQLISVFFIIVMTVTFIFLYFRKK